jgi:hypothetical protein
MGQLRGLNPMSEDQHPPTNGTAQHAHNFGKRPPCPPDGERTVHCQWRHAARAFPRGSCELGSASDRFGLRLGEGRIGNASWCSHANPICQKHGFGSYLKLRQVSQVPIKWGGP